MNISPERVVIRDSFEYRPLIGGSAGWDRASGGGGGKKCAEMTGIIERLGLGKGVVDWRREPCTLMLTKAIPKPLPPSSTRGGNGKSPMATQSEVLLVASRFKVVREYQETSEGERPREIVRHPGAVVVLPLLDDGRVCLIRNYRISVNQTLIELPAGTLEPGEEPIVNAERELIEETGYRAAKLEQLHAFYLSPGILDERMHLFVATGLTAGETALEAGEEIENLIVPWEEALAMATDGRIQDAKSIVGLLLVDRLLNSGRLNR
jgi:ADP-ribose pyrophosphatase